MKQILVILLISGAHVVFSQDYMTTIAEKSCACLEKVPDTLETQQFNMELGLCMIEASMPYKKQIKKDHNINLENIDTEGEKLGRLIGIKMVSVCPNILVKMTSTSKSRVNAKQNAEEAEGTITKIEKDFFVTFSIKDGSGKVNKYYWLTAIESDSDLVNNYSSLEGKSVSIAYKPIELFDPRINEYRQFLVIQELYPVE